MCGRAQPIHGVAGVCLYAATRVVGSYVFGVGGGGGIAIVANEMSEEIGECGKRLARLVRCRRW